MIMTIILAATSLLIFLAVIGFEPAQHILRFLNTSLTWLGYGIAIVGFWYCLYSAGEYCRQSTPLSDQEWRYFIVCCAIPPCILLMVILETVLRKK